MNAELNRTLMRLSRMCGVNALVRRLQRSSVLVLAYHGVVSDWHGEDAYTYRNTVSVDEFAYQLRVLRRWFNPIGVRDWVAALNGGPPLPERPVLITFDDGYRNNLTHAAPLLEREGFPALISVCTGYVGSDRPLWTDEIVHRVMEWTRPTLPMLGGEPPRPIPADRPRRARLAHRVRSLCKQVPDTERRTYLDRLRHESGDIRADIDAERLAFLNWAEVRELARRGFDIGSHTVDHPILSRLSRDELTRQLVQSRADIERETGCACLWIAYPNGQPADVSADVEAAAAKAGYQLGLMGTNRFVRHPANVLALDRIGVPGHVSRDAFHARISGVHALVEGRRSNGRLRVVVEDRSARPLETRLLTRFDDLEGLAPEWEHLWAASPNAQIFGSFRWMRAWWKAYGNRCTLCTPAVFDEGRLIGLLPLVREGRALRFMGTPGADYNDVICDVERAEEVVRELLEAVAALIGPSENCALENIPSNSVLASQVSLLPESLRARLLVRGAGPCPTVELGARRDEVVDAILRKESLRRHRNRLQRAGCVTFRHLTDRSEIKQHLPTFFRQHATRRAMAGARSSFTSPEARAFCEALVDELDPHDQLRFGVLELDRRPLAYHLGFESRGKLLWYKPAFDVNCWDFSPGEVMLSHLFEYARARRLDEFDFTRGGEAAKDRFANRVRQNYTMQLFPSGIRGRAALQAYRVREWLKTHEALFALLKRSRGRLDEWRRAAVIAVRGAGVPGLLRRLASKLVQVLFARDEVMVFVDGPAERPEELGLPPGAEIEIQFGTLADAAEISIDHPEVLDAAKLLRVRERLKRGDRLCIARCRGRVAHFNWIGVRTELVATEVGADVRIPLEPPAYVSYDAWTSPDFRGLGLFTYSLHAILSHVRDTGKRCWNYCRVENRASLRVIERNGFQPTHRMIRLRVLGWTWSWVQAVDAGATATARPASVIHDDEAGPSHLLSPVAIPNDVAQERRSWSERVDV